MTKGVSRLPEKEVHEERSRGRVCTYQGRSSKLETVLLGSAAESPALGRAGGGQPIV